MSESPTDDGSVEGFWSGALHPITGLDHVIGMIVVGIWAAQLGGRYLWTVPLSFISLMVIGGVVGIAVDLAPFKDHGIMMSFLILAVVVTVAARLPLWVSCVIAALFALCHGYLHGIEIPLSPSGLAYGAGFLISTLALLLLGLGLGLPSRDKLLRDW